MNRKQILADCPEEFREILKTFLDNLACEIDLAWSALEEIRSYRDLKKVEETADILKTLSRNFFR